MKKSISILMSIVMAGAILSGCASKPSGGSKDPVNSELVNGRFTETRKITVEVYDRGNDGGSKPEDNFFTDYIKEGMLRDHNVEVEFVPVPRWTEVEQINNLLAAGTAPDIAVTYSYPTVQTYANMGGVLDLNPLLEEHKALLPNLWNLLTDHNIYYNQDPETKSIWAIEARLANSTRINTFVRKDWLAKLDLPEPTTMEEFEAMLVAFRDNAELLLGRDANKMVPYSMSYDVGWRADHMLASFIPSSITDKELFIYGFDSRRILLPGFKEGVRKLNDWYNDGLMWKDFPLYGAGDTTEENMFKAGYIGAFAGNWDLPYRGEDNSIENSIRREFGEDAGYIAVMPFKNDANKYTKFLPGPVDRKLFFPTTNKEPLASLLYLDWISRPEVIKFLQTGEEGVHHEVMADGALKILPVSGEKIMNSPQNIDYTITNNGLNLGDHDLNVRSMALGYPGVEADVIMQAYNYSIHDGRFTPKFNVGEIVAETGMGPALDEKRDTLLTRSVVAPRDRFDAEFDGGINDYLNSGGQAIIDERKAAYERFYE
jgi:putative aldouronate transport system substrate-binding protein